jgi:hypothetical protein
MIAIMCDVGTLCQTLSYKKGRRKQAAGKDEGRTMRKIMIRLAVMAMGMAAGGWFYAPGQVAANEDGRELVNLPPMMREHMLGNMRDHLRALDEMLGALARGDADKAGEIAEERLGMSSLGRHGAAHMGKFMPKAMSAIGTQMHRAASRFVKTVADAELSPGKDAQRKVYGALQAIIENCNACHAAYRIR